MSTVAMDVSRRTAQQRAQKINTTLAERGFRARFPEAHDALGSEEPTGFLKALIEACTECQDS